MLNLRFTPKFMLGMVAAAAMTTSVALSGCSNNEQSKTQHGYLVSIGYPYNPNDSAFAARENAFRESIIIARDDSLKMVEAIKAMKGINLNRLSHDYDLASQKRENARNEVEIAKKDGKPNIKKEKEAKMQKVFVETQSVVDKYEDACRIKQLANGDAYRKNEEMRELFKNKPVMNVLNKYGFVVVDGKTVIHVKEQGSMFILHDDRAVVLLPSSEGSCRVFDIKSGFDITGMPESHLIVKELLESQNKK